jgi:hypothetical protein
MLFAWFVSWLRGKPLDSGSALQPIERFFLWWRVKKILEQGGLTIEHMESKHYSGYSFPGRRKANCVPKTLVLPF